MTAVSEKESGLNDRYLRLLGVPLIAITGLLSLMQFFFQGRWDLFGKYLIASIIYTALTWEMCRIVLIRIRRRLGGLENIVLRLMLSILYFLIIAGIGNAIVKFILQQLGLRPPSMEGKPFFEWWLLNMPNVLFFVLLLSSVYEAIYFFDQYKNARKKAEGLRNSQAQQQLDMLKNRVNPHFLFNSLTTLSALIGEDAPRAERFVDELSKVYRYLLRAGKQRFATIGEELQFADSYAFLLKNRFESGAFNLTNSYQVHPDAPLKCQAADRNVPVLSLQNAIDYLLRTQNTPLDISMEIAQHQLLVSCVDRPKARTFDLSDNDWLQLAGHGARQEVVAGRLSISIPFTSNSLST